MQRTLKHPDAIGNGSLSALFSRRLDHTTFGTDAQSLACLRLTFTPENAPGTVPAVHPHAATYTVAATTNVITLAVKCQTASGADAGDVSFTITPAGAKVDWSAGAASAYTLKDVIDLINEDNAGGTNGALLAGFKASIGPGGMYDMLVDQTSAGFLPESATYIQPAGTTGTGTSFFKRDMAVWTTDSDFLAVWRLTSADGREENRDMFKLLDLYGTVGTDTGATLYVVRDDVEDFVQPTGTWATDIANHEEIYSVTAASLPAYAGYVGAYAMNHNPAEAAPVRGPLVVILKGDTGDTQTLNINAIMQAVYV